MTDAAGRSPVNTVAINPEALLVALVLAPGTYSRNRHFQLLERTELKKARKRARELRGIVKDLTEPWHKPGARSPEPGPDSITEREIEGAVHLEYRVTALDFRRHAVLTPLEAATVHYAVAKSGRGTLSEADRLQVETALLELGPK